MPDIQPPAPKRTPISDKGKLTWERFHGPMQSAAAMLNTAIRNTENLLAGEILRGDGLSPETHFFDMDKMEAVEKPPQ